jgi:1-acyl-sn-glycerol-3-phosphate acyltransferase
VRLYPSVIGYSLRPLLKLMLRFFLHIHHDMEAELPPGPKVFAVNHPTVWDAFPILAFARGNFVHTLVEEQIWSFLLPRLIFTLSNQIVLRRGRDSIRSLRDAHYVLSRGHSVLISPEGGRTGHGERVRARRGVARLAVEARAAVIPVGVWIASRDIVMRKVRYRCQDKRYTVDSYFPRFRADYGVLFGAPVRLDPYFGRELCDADYQAIATDILRKVYELSSKARRLVAH